MKIQVDCRAGGDPRAFHLGTRRLHVVRVLERAAGDAKRRFKVSVEDGRFFTLVHDTAKGEWQLAAVGAFPQKESASSAPRTGTR